MTATVLNGTAPVIGSTGLAANGAPLSGFQQAYGYVNTAGVLVDTETTLNLQQKLGRAIVIGASNIATANSVASVTGTTLDPSILTLNQTSAAGIRQLDFQSVVDNDGKPTQTVTHLYGFQPDDVEPGHTPGSANLFVYIGNQAIAFAGATGPNYNIGTSAAGDGTATISGVTQNTVFGINNITGGPGAGVDFHAATDAGAETNAWLVPIGYDNQSTGFLQYVHANNISVEPNYDGDSHNAAGLTGVVNIIAARVNTGSASIAGTARTAATDPTTQSFTSQLNSALVGGTVSGTLTQVALNMNQSGYNSNGLQAGISYSGFVNLAVANATTGPASLTNVSQNMNQSLNAVAGAAGVDFNLNQNVTSPVGGAAPSCTLCSNNIQIAAGSNQSTIAGAQQFINNSVNVAALGGVSGNSTITQTATNVTMSGVNQLVALSSFNASISGTQSAISAINVIGK